MLRFGKIQLPVVTQRRGPLLGLDNEALPTDFPVNATAGRRRRGREVTLETRGRRWMNQGGGGRRDGARALLLFLVVQLVSHHSRNCHRFRVIDGPGREPGVAPSSPFNVVIELPDLAAILANALAGRPGGGLNNPIVAARMGALYVYRRWGRCILCHDYEPLVVRR